MAPMLALESPLPREESTPPVTKMNFVFIAVSSPIQGSFSSAALKIHEVYLWVSCKEIRTQYFTKPTQRQAKRECDDLVEISPEDAPEIRQVETGSPWLPVSKQIRLSESLPV
jgi:hypothetical protein